MAELVLQAGDDHVGRLAHEGDPLRAVVELIWNSIDAEAETVTVRLRRDDVLEAIAEVVVEDNGHGISPEEVPTTFGRIGDSWKRFAMKSKNGKRRLHGELGEGRLRVFALGSQVAWQSRSRDIAGVFHDVHIWGTSAKRHVFQWEVRPSQTRSTVTTVTARNEAQKSLGALEADTSLAMLRSHFAPVLLNDENLTITFDSTPLNPNDEVLHKTFFELPFGGKTGNEHKAELLIIEWRSGRHRATYYGPDSEHFVHEEPGKDIEAQFSYSAYVSWPGLDHDALAVLPLGDMAPEPVCDLWDASRKAIRGHFNNRRRERRRAQVDKWKQDGTYPYTGEPASETEKAERAIFDVVSGALSQQISTRKRDAQLTLSLLRDALRRDPEKLTTIVHEVVALNDADRQTLTKLLGETTLPAIIKAANLVASRNKFLGGLEHLLFDPADSPEVGERDHLHRVLERELWIFGESYHLMNSERGLTEMLRTHLKLEGLPSSDVRPVKRWDGKSGRVDLHLAGKSKEHDRIRHLVVELKAPGITLGRKELDQVEDYTNTVLTNSAFSSDRSHWDFVLVGTDFDELVDNRLNTENRELGEFLSPPKKPGRPQVRAYVRRWRDILDENHRRLDFVTSNLEHDPSISEGLAYVREQYSDLLPRSNSTDPTANPE
jgi:Histidine kinase-, DNA gyrase B-, and HSP90-like ATPase